MIDFATTQEDAALIEQTVDRAFDMFRRSGVEIDPVSLEMDLTACHLNGCPLRLEDLLAAPASSFVHDVRGISLHLNRETGALTDHFLPRYAEPQIDPALAPYMDPTGERIDPSLLA